MTLAAGIRLTLLIGPGLPVPAPAFVLTAMQSVEVAVSDSERSGFELVFRAGRDPRIAGDSPIVASPQLVAGARTIIIATVGALPVVLMDGIVQETNFSPGAEGGGSFTLRGFDLTAAMDQEERSTTHPAQGPGDIARAILLRYATYGIIPDVVDPLGAERPNPVEWTPIQNVSDYVFLKNLADQFDHVFTIEPGPVPMSSRAYWGPPPAAGLPKRALTVDMGPATNVANLNFENNEGQAASVQGEVQDRSTNVAVPVVSMPVSARLPLAAQPARVNTATARTRRYQAPSARSAGQALSEAQAQSDAASETVSATGDLDTARYGGVLTPRNIVGLRGAGHSNDGNYRVRNVVHKIKPGQWLQSFTLSREGQGTTVPVVVP
jgi:phage protein D